MTSPRDRNPEPEGQPDASAQALGSDDSVVVPFPGPEDRREVGGDDDVDIDELRVALEDLRREIRSRFDDSEAGAANEIDWMELFSELRRRVGTFGMVERSGVVDEFGLDEVVLNRSQRLLDFLFQRYWRVELSGIENLPTAGPALFVANRSGLLPYDGLMISHALGKGRPVAERPRFLVADWLITLPFVQPALARVGGVRACRENADRLLRTGHSIVAFPEGAKGAAKVFRERYRLQRFGRGGVVRAAIEAGVPLIPVGVVGAEEAHPVLFKSQLAGRAFGLPFVPVTPTFPLFGPIGVLPLPTKWVISFGSPLPLSPEDGSNRERVADELLVSRLTEELRAEVERLVSLGLERRESVWS